MVEGQMVSFSMPDEAADDITIVGWISGIMDDGGIEVTEAHAFHRVWGGSNNSRGEKMIVSATEIRDCPAAYRHIVRAAKTKLGG